MAEIVAKPPRMQEERTAGARAPLVAAKLDLLLTKGYVGVTRGMSVATALRRVPVHHRRPPRLWNATPNGQIESAHRPQPPVAQAKGHLS